MYKVWNILLDRGLLVLMCILVAPPVLVTAALIKLSSRGPLFTKQIRLGKDAQPFVFYKFRTMYTSDDESIYAQEFAKDLIDGKYGEVGKSPLLKIRNDPRITPVGRFLLSTHMDELPQLIAALKGDMALIGPRPGFPFEYEKYEEWHKERLKIKPGLTGLAQVELYPRQTVTLDEMVRLDVEYIRNRSVLMDLRILFKTVIIAWRE